MQELILPNNYEKCILKNWYDLELLFTQYKFENEAKLYQTKWGDYLQFHPINADIIFFECYKYCYKWYYSKYFDCEDSVVKRGVAEDKLFINATGVIKAVHEVRKIADRLGMPYGYYCSYFIKIAIEENLWQHLPLVTQMRVENIVKRVEEEWLETQGCFQMMPEDDYLQFRNDNGDYLQYLYRQRLLIESENDIIKKDKFIREGFLDNGNV